MKILTSNFEPLLMPNESFVSRWEKLFQSSQSLKIGVAYASNDSLLFLKKLIEFNQPKHLDICLGMAYFEGLSKSQFEATKELNTFLKSSNNGGVFVSRLFPFHGKVHFFKSSSQRDSFLVGSSNLSNIVPTKGVIRRNYEVDIEIHDSKLCIETEELLNQLIQVSSSDFDSISKYLRVRENSHFLLSSRSDIENVDQEKLQMVITKSTKNSFEIPLKDAPKSNLNAYFGKGRVHPQGFVQPRHWYEVEVIVDNSVQQSALSYPANQEFIVYTDDGYRFPMKTSGDNGKNLRSRDDLTILGRWIKGRMEASPALKSGELLTSSSFDIYGRDTISLTQTSLVENDSQGAKLPVWYLDFGITEMDGPIETS